MRLRQHSLDPLACTSRSRNGPEEPVVGFGQNCAARRAPELKVTKHKNSVSFASYIDTTRLTLVPRLFNRGAYGGWPAGAVWSVGLHGHIEGDAVQALQITGDALIQTF